MVAFVTGASGGIGSVICKTLSEKGYAVAAAYNNNEQGAALVVREIVSTGGRAIAVKCDVSDPDSVMEAYEKTVSRLGGVSLLVNNAGMAHIGLFTDMTAAQIGQMLSVNLSGAMLVTKAFLPDMIRKRSGNIINISSMWGEVGASCEVVYSAAKAGLIGFTKALAKEEGLSGVRVNCITAGLIDTPMNAQLLPDDIAALVDEIPLSRIGLPQDVANAVEFLASERSSYITGAVIKVNGGLCI